MHTTKSIVLTGFMGVGKTTVGELVAQKLNRSFIDIDKEIEKDFQMTISDLFALHGEAFFRNYEKEKTCSLAKEPFHVLSLGGGAFLQPDIQQTCLEHCIVIYLDIDWEEWKERMSLLIDSRPILQSKSLPEVEKLFYSRRAVYSINHSTVKVDYRSPEEIADSIVDLVKETTHLQ